MGWVKIENTCEITIVKEGKLPHNWGNCHISTGNPDTQSGYGYGLGFLPSAEGSRDATTSVDPGVVYDFFL